MITRAGDHEEVKAAVHALIGTAAVTCLIYNALVCADRPAPRNMMNCCVYGALAWFEWKNVVRHLQA